MAKISMQAREDKRIRSIKRLAVKRADIKSKLKDANLSINDRMDLQSNLQKLPRDSSPSRLTRRCQLCARPKSVYRKFKLCRICLRKRLMNGQVTGGRKSSW